MRAFVRVVDAGSFAAAARELNQSPAAVTRLLADLEDHLGARLINRTTRRLALTDTGELYLERVRQILTEIEEAEAQAAAATSEPRGHLRVLVPPAFAVHQLAKHLPRFHSQHPLVTLEFSSPGPVETIDEAFDVTIIQTGRPLSGGDFVARLLARAEVIACASPEYLDRRGRPNAPEDLPKHEALMPPFVRELNFQRGSGESITLSPGRATLSTTHIDTMYAAALAGLGVAGLPSYVAEDALLEHALERILPEWHMFTSHLYVAMPTRKHVPARTRAFVDFLLQTFGGRDADPWLVAAGCESPKPAQ
jgi:DNA-binding transcriptional LysR family regulator